MGSGKSGRVFRVGKWPGYAWAVPSRLLERIWPVGGDQNHLTKQSSKLAVQFWGRNEGRKGKAKPPRLTMGTTHRGGSFTQLRKQAVLRVVNSLALAGIIRFEPSSHLRGAPLFWRTLPSVILLNCLPALCSTFILRKKEASSTLQTPASTNKMKPVPG